MLWDIIFDFYTQYIFGGFDSNDVLHSAFFGELYSFEDGVNPYGTYEILTLPFKDLSGAEVYLTFGNYLSLIATIITIVAILLFCVFIVKKIIGIIFRLFSGSSVF